MPENTPSIHERHVLGKESPRGWRKEMFKDGHARDCPWVLTHGWPFAPMENPAPAFNVYEWANAYAKANRIALFDISPTYETPASESSRPPYPVWKLHWLVVPKTQRKSGKGTKAMEALCAKADEHGVMLVLNLAERAPSALARDVGTTSRARLKRFYKRFGFVLNTGRKAEHTVSEEMYRAPS